jgi:hypothetical protein
MIQLTPTEAQHILDTLLEVDRNPEDVKQHMQEELSQSIEIIEVALSYGIK